MCVMLWLLSGDWVIVLCGVGCDVDLVWVMVICEGVFFWCVLMGV